MELNLLHTGQYSRSISFRRYLHHRALARRFRTEARRRLEPDVVVTAFPIIDLAYEAVEYAVVRGIPVIVDVRDLWPDILVDLVPGFLRPAATGLLRRAYRRSRRLLSAADSVVAVSHGYLRWASALGERQSADSDTVYYIGFDDTGRDAVERSSHTESFWRSLAGKTVFTFVGSFGRSYELSLVCDAAERLCRQGDGDTHFVLAGDGDQFRSVLRRAKALPNVSLVGWLGGDDLRRVLKASHVGLAPCVSRPDTMPNKVFEYLAAGIPVISSLRGEMEQVLEETNTGLSYDPGDVETFCRHVGKLAREETLRRTMAINARELFLARFDAQDIYRGFVNHIEKVAETAHERTHAETRL